jgi:hypothetical protein
MFVEWWKSPACPRYFDGNGTGRWMLTHEEAPMVELTVNEREIPLNRFVAALLEAQLIATVDSLKDIPGPITRIRLTVTPEGD